MFLKVENSHIQESNHDVWMYNLKNDDFNIAGVNLTGPYPEGGRQVVNQEVDTIFMVLEGSATIRIGRKESYRLFMGDIYFLRRGMPYSIKPYMCEEVKFWIVSTPRFRDTQHHVLD